jgi:transposase
MYYIHGMMPPIFVRPVTDAERQRLEAGLRSSDAFVLRRCQILLASARGEPAPQIAHQLGCNDQTVRNAIKAFNRTGLACLSKGYSRPHTIHAAFSGEKAEQLRALLHQSPRTFDKPTKLWTLELAAEVSFQQGLTPDQVSGETIRATLARLGVRWQGAKEWITSPDPAYARKKGRGIV